MTSLPQQRKLITEIPGPNSRALHARKTAAVATGVGTTLPIYIQAASGGILQDVDGNQLIDLGSGIAVVNVGHTDPHVVSRVQAQVEKLTHSCFMVTPYAGYVEVCEQLNRLTPGDHDKKSALFNSGAEAVENAVKIARRATGRTAVVTFDHGYHGRTNLTMAMTAKSMPYKYGFGPFASEIYRAPGSYPYREPIAISGPAAAQRAIDLIEKQIGADQVACVVIEPIAGEGGFIVPEPGFLAGLSSWCTENGVVFIADEIQTGFARTGYWFTSAAENIIPDLITSAKGIAGGLPLAAVTGRAELMDSVHLGGLGGTYGGNPVTCAAALGAIASIEHNGLLARATHLGELMTQRLTALAETQSIIGQVRGRGAMVALEIVHPGGTQADPGRTAAISAACHQAGVLTLTCGTYGNVLRLLPPLVLGDDLLAEALDVLASAVEQAA